MPELPEVEAARLELEAGALGRRITSVDDHDTFVCRPHAPGELADALTGTTLTSAHRRGKSMWVDTDRGPVLGLHLGMAGRIAIDEEPDHWDRFAVGFADGGRMALRDKRRLSRAILDPDLSSLGPDAAEVSRGEFAQRVRRGRGPLKARLLDQSVVAGVGNLLADETLWRARLSPLLPASELRDDQAHALWRALRAATRDAIRMGGVHTGRLIVDRRHNRTCPRCGAELLRATVGGRTTFWCSREQAA